MMGSSPQYKYISKTYDLLDTLYFKNEAHSPRKAVCDEISTKNGLVLDLCTGTAANVIEAAGHNRGASFTGIDISEEMLRIAEVKAKSLGLENLELCKMDASELDFKDNTFDIILISLVLHELPEKLAEKMLLEAKRVLKSDGIILVTEWEEPQKLTQKIRFWVIKQLEPKGFKNFLKMNTKKYFENFGLQIAGVKHCDYTKVIKLNKELLR